MPSSGSWGEKGRGEGNRGREEGKRRGIREGARVRKERRRGLWGGEGVRARIFLTVTVCQRNELYVKRNHQGGEELPVSINSYLSCQKTCALRMYHNNTVEIWLGLDHPEDLSIGHFVQLEPHPLI